MSIPFSQIYNFLVQYVDSDILIYLFCSAGSKKIQDISILFIPKCLESIDTLYKRRQVIHFLFHDQEPLNFDLYQNHDINDLYFFYRRHHLELNEIKKHGILDFYLTHASKYNLNLFKPLSEAPCWLLTHSELNSNELKKYQAIGAVGVYWWSHALIARDWYRYAQSDWKLKYNPDHQFEKTFNIYNRAWTGTREYRLKFTEMIITSDLVRYSLIKFSPFDQDTHYTQHQFKNLRFQITTNLEILSLNQSTSCYSADYDAKDYSDCAIDVVLETLFDDSRIHLTEKTLRPIACGKPFIIVSSPGSLAYLKDYGFKTFGNLIDESYDQIIDPVQRLESIIQLMQEISNLSDRQKKELFAQMHIIAQHNQSLFWSDQFEKDIINEFVENYQQGYRICQQSKSDKSQEILIEDQPEQSKENLIKLIETFR